MKRTTKQLSHGPDWQAVGGGAQSEVVDVVGSADEVTEPLAESCRVYMRATVERREAVLPLSSPHPASVFSVVLSASRPLLFNGMKRVFF